MENEKVEKKNSKQEKNKKIKASSIIAIIIFVVLVAIFLGLLLWNNSKEPAKIDSYESEKLETFSSNLKDRFEQAKTMQYPEAREFIVSGIYDSASELGGTDNVDYFANMLLSSIPTADTGDVTKMITDLQAKADSLLEDLLGGLLNTGTDSDVPKKTITLKSNTVCTDGDIDQKYCVEKLNANVYIADKNSDKWAVLIHGYMMSGSLMYMAVGDMYTSQGYNVIAPDLRGFGSSDGSVAMGYLESLDVYDWIKDLNANWNDSARYGVTKAPETIVVHGISLGGATTLQIATNPDIAGKVGGPYTHNLDDLKVKGFVDDCGYTSMSGIITGMLSMGDTLQLSSILGSLGIEEIDFMAEFNKLTEQIKLPGFENFDLETLTQATPQQQQDYLKQLTEAIAKVEEQINNYQTGNAPVQQPEIDKEVIAGLIEKYAGPYSSYIPEFPTGVYPKVEETDAMAVIDGLVGQVLRTLVGVGLNEDNYDKYSDVFSEGRAFAPGKKVMIIHGTADTTVPYSNAGVVAENVAPATLVYKWDVTAAPHAFIVVGQNKSDYTKLIANFTKCVPDVNCTSITK